MGNGRRRPGQTTLAFLSPKPSSGERRRRTAVGSPANNGTRLGHTGRPPREEIVLRAARMTKAAALLLAGSMALAACASDQKSGSASGNSSSGGGDLKIGLAYDTGGRGDRSFNDSAFAGVEA